MRRAAFLLALCLLAGAARAQTDDADDDGIGANWAISCGKSGVDGGWTPVADASAVSSDLLTATLKEVESVYGANISAWLNTQSWSCVLGDNLNISASGCYQVVAGTNYILQVNLTCALGDSDYTLGVIVEAFEPLPTANKTAVKIYDVDFAFVAKDGQIVDSELADDDGAGRWKWDSASGDWAVDDTYADDSYADDDGDGKPDDLVSDGVTDDGKGASLVDSDGDGLSNDIAGDKDGDGYREVDTTNDDDNTK